MTADIEEVIVQVYVSETKQLRPDTREQLRRRRVCRTLHDDLIAAELRQRWQGFAIDFAAWGEWKLVDNDERRGNHVFRQSLL